jgi:hypothetical protein
MKNLELFLDLIKFYPNMQILELGKIDEMISSEIANRLTTGDLKKFNFDSYSVGDFNVDPRSFEYVVIYNIFDIELIELSYHSLENSGDLIILLPKGKFDLWNLKEQIEKRSFVAVNDIELLDEYDVITAKKMHMWTRGY